MLFRLILIFVSIPILELFLLIEIGRLIGALNTVAIVVITGIVGAAFAKSQGLEVYEKIKEDLRIGVLPTNQLLDGILILIGGALLITPGLITDTTGFLMILPYTRSWLKEKLKKWLEKKIESGKIYVYHTYYK
ncbi:MAG: FxsA family protein [Candidatus Hydrothermarchaeota archaeon]